MRLILIIICPTLCLIPPKTAQPLCRLHAAFRNTCSALHITSEDDHLWYRTIYILLHTRSKSQSSPRTWPSQRGQITARFTDDIRRTHAYHHRSGVRSALSSMARKFTLADREDWKTQGPYDAYVVAGDGMVVFTPRK